MPAFFDILESRMLLSVAVNSAGWTQVTPSADSRLVYVSSSQGSDTNTGLSPLSPVQTIAKGESLLRNGMPDELLLKTGDIFYDTFGFWNWSGLSAQEPLVVSSYDMGAHPIVASGTGIAFNIAGKPTSNVDIIGISFYANGRDPANGPVDGTTNPTGVRWVSSGSNVLIENCSFNFYGTDVDIESYLSPINNVVFRRNQVLNSYTASGAHSQGLYADGVNGLDIEDNIFDHNGWNATVPGAQATVFNHNVYIQVSCTGLIFNDNISARASATGIQARPGGQITNNVFIDDPIAITFGLVNGGDAMVAGGVSGTISGNVIIGGATIAGSPRGTAMSIDNIASATISNNIMIGDSNCVAPAIELDLGSPGTGVPNTSVGINDLTISGNIIYHWTEGLSINPSMIMGGTGPNSINGLVVQNNQFVAPTNGIFLNQGPAFVASAETWQNNHYVPPYNAAKAFQMGGIALSVNSWQQAAEASATTPMATFPNPNRTIATYNVSLGGPNNIAGFLANADKVSSQNWNLNYTAAGPISYINAGFGMTPAAGIHIQAPAAPAPVNSGIPSPSTSILGKQITLTRQPLSNVQLIIKITNRGSGQTNAFTLTFTSANWNVPQSLPSAITAMLLKSSDKSVFSISGTTISADRAFNGLIVNSSTASILPITPK